MPDRLQQLEAIVAQLVQTQNAMIDGAKTNDELPLQSPFDPTSKIRAYRSATSEIITPQQIIDAAVLIANKDRFTIVMGTVLDENDLTVNAGWQWNISGYVFTNPEAVELEVPYAASGKTRIDLLVADTLNNFQIVTGTEYTLPTAAIAPAVPLNTLLASFIYVTDDSVSEPTNPDSAPNFYYEFWKEGADLEAATAGEIVLESSFAFIQDIGILQLARYHEGNWVYYDILGGGGGTNTPIPYLTLRLKSKGVTSGTPNIASTLEINDLVEGFVSPTEYWTTAQYNGGDVTDSSNYTPLVNSSDW